MIGFTVSRKIKLESLSEKLFSGRVIIWESFFLAMALEEPNAYEMLMITEVPSKAYFATSIFQITDYVHIEV